MRHNHHIQVRLCKLRILWINHYPHSRQMNQTYQQVVSYQALTSLSAHLFAIHNIAHALQCRQESTFRSDDSLHRARGL